MHRTLSSTLALLAAVALLSSCFSLRSGRCYLAETRYLAIKQIFIETGSYQRAVQAMRDDQWSDCEIDQFRYRMRKELGLEGPDFQRLQNGEALRKEQLDRLDLNAGNADR